MSLNEEMRELRPVWIALLALSLLYLTSKTYGQEYQSYIGLHVRGDTISIDTAVVFDLRTYRTIKNYNQTSDEALASKIALINTLEKQVQFGDSIINLQRSQVEMMQYTVHRKDSVIRDLSGSFDQIEIQNNKVINMLDQEINKRDPIFTDERLWIGVGIGFAIGVFLMR